ncbi:hypothetical protein IAR55_003824 [Kwoniella newhampshirensis]|uniref:HMG box domain-containing protein n=1 Tax=Kwoniella newhampshirensis TaxID=1651941 RepID=A0AAW0YXY3_9TREE
MDSTTADTETHSQPLNLAAATAVDITPFIDPTLTGGSEFFPDPDPDAVIQQEHQQHLDNGAAAPTQEDIDAVIKASLDHAQAQAEAEAQAQAQAHDVSTPTSNDAYPSGEENGQVRGRLPRGGSGKLGEEDNPITDAPIYQAPFSKPERGDDSPFPQNYLFDSRAQFEKWLAGESSWCHFVQRRTTTPDKRSAERLQARIRAHNRALEAMTPEERASAAPFKTRRRNRVSPVLEKVTFTCHHAGSYESKHSTVLPKEKLRLNTKKSVKCACGARIVLSENQSGECRVVYHWKHEGHDPFAEVETQGGRLPKVIDDWLNTQIEEGKTLDDIRKVLNMTEEEKESYLQKVAADPSAEDPAKPPALALSQKVKYPDLYNRYRKLKGPVKDNKVLRGTMKRTASGTAKRSESRGASGVIGDGAEEEQGQDHIGSGSGEGGASKRVATDALVSLDRYRSLADVHFLGQPSASASEPTQNEELSHGHDTNDTKTGSARATQLDPNTIGNGEEENPGAGDEEGEGEHDFSQLAAAASNEGLARALLALPSAGGLRDDDGHEMSLEEAMRRMADDVGVVEEVPGMGI